MSFAVSSSASLAAGSAFLGKASSLRVSARRGSGASGRGGPVQTQAFFGMGAQKQPAGVAMVCRDCGYIYRGDFDALPKDYKCPQCNLGKNRFKVVEQAGSAYSNLAAQKKANKAAAAKAKKGKGPSPRELAKQRMIEAQEEADAKKGRGFFGR